MPFLAATPLLMLLPYDAALVDASMLRLQKYIQLRLMRRQPRCLQLFRQAVLYAVFALLLMSFASHDARLRHCHAAYR